MTGTAGGYVLLEVEDPEPGKGLKKGEPRLLGADPGLHCLDIVSESEPRIWKGLHLGNFLQGRLPSIKGGFQLRVVERRPGQVLGKHLEGFVIPCAGAR
jgi:hypothetical protein